MKKVGKLLAVTIRRGIIPSVVNGRGVFFVECRGSFEVVS
jgi:hypothetical protein